MIIHSTATEIVINAGRKQCRSHLHSLKQHLTETLAKVRQTLAAKVTQDGDAGLAELQASLVMPTIEKVKGVLQDLLVCTSKYKVSLLDFKDCRNLPYSFLIIIRRCFYSQS